MPKPRERNVASKPGCRWTELYRGMLNRAPPNIAKASCREKCSPPAARLPHSRKIHSDWHVIIERHERTVRLFRKLLHARPWQLRHGPGMPHGSLRHSRDLAWIVRHRENRKHGYPNIRIFLLAGHDGLSRRRNRSDDWAASCAAGIASRSFCRSRKSFSNCGKSVSSSS